MLKMVMVTQGLFRQDYEAQLELLIQIMAPGSVVKNIDEADIIVCNNGWVMNKMREEHPNKGIVLYSTMPIEINPLPKGCQIIIAEHLERFTWIHQMNSIDDFFANCDLANYISKSHSEQSYLPLSKAA